MLENYVWAWGTVCSRVRLQGHCGETQPFMLPCCMITLVSASEDVSWQPGGTLPEFWAQAESTPQLELQSQRRCKWFPRKNGVVTPAAPRGHCRVLSSLSVVPRIAQMTVPSAGSLTIAFLLTFDEFCKDLSTNVYTLVKGTNSSL